MGVVSVGKKPLHIPIMHVIYETVPFYRILLITSTVLAYFSTNSWFTQASVETEVIFNSEANINILASSFYHEPKNCNIFASLIHKTTDKEFCSVCLHCAWDLLSTVTYYLWSNFFLSKAGSKSLSLFIANGIL